MLFESCVDSLDAALASVAGGARRLELCAHVEVGGTSPDPLLVSQALENLVDNSIRFAPSGSRVEVSARGGDGACRLVVHDEGPGIPEEERAKVFEPFYRGSTPGSQTGLGLAFVADVARKHGGEARLLPSASGTTVAIELPCGRRSV